MGNISPIIKGIIISLAALAIWELFVKKLVVKSEYEDDDDEYYEED